MSTFFLLIKESKQYFIEIRYKDFLFFVSPLHARQYNICMCVSTRIYIPKMYLTLHIYIYNLYFSPMQPNSTPIYPIYLYFYILYRIDFCNTKPKYN